MRFDAYVNVESKAGFEYPSLKTCTIINESQHNNKRYATLTLLLQYILTERHTSFN